MKVYNKIKDLTTLYHDEVVSIRRYLHKNPELSFVEFNTSAFIQKKLSEYGISFKTAFVRRPDEWGAEGPPDPTPNPDHDIIVDSFPDLLKTLEKNLC